MKKTEGVGRHASYNKHLRPFGKRWANKKTRRFAKKQIDRQIGRS